MLLEQKMNSRKHEKVVSPPPPPFFPACVHYPCAFHLVQARESRSPFGEHGDQRNRSICNKH